MSNNVDIKTIIEGNVDLRVLFQRAVEAHIKTAHTKFEKEERERQRRVPPTPIMEDDGGLFSPEEKQKEYERSMERAGTKAIQLRTVLDVRKDPGTEPAVAARASLERQIRYYSSRPENDRFPGTLA